MSTDALHSTVVPGSVERLDVHWRSTTGADQLVPVYGSPDVFRGTTKEPLTFFELGWLEGPRTATQLVTKLGELGLNNVAVPVLTFKPSESIEETLIEGPIAAIHAVNSSKGAHPETPTILSGNSMGAGTALITAHHAPELAKAVAANSAVGLTPGDTMSTFARAVVRNSARRDQWLHESGNQLSVRELTSGGLRDLLRRNSNPRNGAPGQRWLPSQLRFALGFDGLTTVRDIVDRQVPVRLFYGEHDIFDPVRVKRNLSERGIDPGIVEVVPGSHSASVSRAGLRNAKHAITWAHANRSKTAA